MRQSQAEPLFSDQPRSAEPAPLYGVSGDLTLHGVTKQVSVDVTRQNDAYVGTVRIKQTEFDIQPIKIGGGVVRVKDELEISFRVYTASR